MALITDLQYLTIDSEIELFELSEYNPASPSDIFRFTNHVGVSFGGIAYTPLACEIEGIVYSAEGSLPRPKLRLSDASGYVSSLIYSFDGLEGAKITIRKTLKRYLDGQASPDSSQEKPRDIFQISQRTQEIPGKIIEYELAAMIDFNDETLPRRICASTCMWRYRDANTCGYGGSAMFTITGASTTDPTKDICGKDISDCQKRFPTGALPYGGFPSIRRV